MLQVFFNEKLGDCYETVIAAMASHIEQLQGEIRYKQHVIDQLERQTKEARDYGKDILDSSKDPFEDEVSK